MEKIIYTVAGIFFIVVMIGIYSENKACKERGGILVKSVFSYECIKF